MNARPAALFMWSPGKEGSGGRDAEGERGGTFVAIQYTFLTFGQHNSWHGGH